MPMPSRALSSPGAPRLSRGLRLIMFAVGMASFSAYCTKASDSGSGGSGGAHGGTGGASGTSTGGSSSGGAVGSGGTSSASGGDTSSGGATSTGGIVASSGGVVGTGGMVASSGGIVGSGGMTTSGSGGDTSTAGDAAVTDAACQMATVKFTPKIPTVFVLVDRSGSEFTDATTGTYFTLQAAVLQVIKQLQATVRFGFGDFVGDHGGSMCKTVFNSVPIGLNNYDAISKQYMTDGPLLPFGTKAETPAADVLPMVKTLLTSDSGDGGKYILFVTDSQTDFCDDGGPVCPADAVTYRIQDMYTAGIGTMVIGLPTAQSNIASMVLQNLANAGAGQVVALPSGVGANSSTDIASQCNSVAAWKAIATAASTPAMTSLATYGTPAGTATVFTPTSTSQAALANQIAAAVNGVKSCTFDLGNVGGQAIKVDLNQLASAHVCLSTSCPDTSEVPQDATNGWSMSSATQLILNGTACDKWRMPSNNDISFDFPCKSIIFE
jgi:hypothetical protein